MSHVHEWTCERGVHVHVCTSLVLDDSFFGWGPLTTDDIFKEIYYFILATLKINKNPFLKRLLNVYTM